MQQLPQTSEIIRFEGHQHILVFQIGKKILQISTFDIMLLRIIINIFTNDVINKLNSLRRNTGIWYKI